MMDSEIYISGSRVLFAHHTKENAGADHKNLELLVRCVSTPAVSGL